ncbi:hypothetical protein ABVK25_002635 [Lepraria finkii]|uniref:Uncharacterized protein n=1 Tax=Lepraria finkii TaxID=1340010 RepID=A0ABR4BJ97_9LECA
MENQRSATPPPGTDLFLDATQFTPRRHPTPLREVISKIVHSIPSSPEDLPATTPWNERHFTVPSGKSRVVPTYSLVLKPMSDKQTKAAARPRLSVQILPSSSDSDEVHTLPNMAPFLRLSSRSPHPAGPSLAERRVRSTLNARAAEFEDLSGCTPKSSAATLVGRPMYSLIAAKAADSAVYQGATTNATSSSPSEWDLSGHRPYPTATSLTVTRTPSRIAGRVADLGDLPGRPLSSNTTSLAGRPSYSRVAGRTTVPAALQARATQSNSKTWVNSQIKEHEKWQQIEKNMKRMFHRSNCVPMTYHDYLQHRVLFQQDRQAEQARKLADLRASSRRSHPGLPPPGPKAKIFPALRGKMFNDNRSAILATPSIWCLWWKETEQHPQALWPCLEEMKEEGDERMTSGFRRFPAMPRVPGNATVTYKQKSPLKPEKFDKVWRKKHIFAKIQAERDAEEAKARKVEQEKARLMALKEAIDTVAEAVYLGLTQAEARAKVEVEAEESAEKLVAEDTAKEAEAEYEEIEALVGQGLMDAISF